MGQEGRAFVVEVIVPGNLAAFGISRLEEGIQRRVQPAGGNLGDDFLPGPAVDREQIGAPG